MLYYKKAYRYYYFNAKRSRGLDVKEGDKV